MYKVDGTNATRIAGTTGTSGNGANNAFATSGAINTPQGKTTIFLIQITLRVSVNSMTILNRFLLPGIAADTNGKVYFADTGNHCIRLIDNDR